MLVRHQILMDRTGGWATESPPDMTNKPPTVSERFGTILGLAPGDVAAYSSDYDTANAETFPDRSSYRSYLDGHYMGVKWQCVEFARRWLYVNHGYVFDDVAMAYDIFKVRSVRTVADGKELPLNAFRNGSRRRPEPGGLLIWNESEHFPTTGHVAVITEVNDDVIRVAEQNYAHHKWPTGQNFSRELELTHSETAGYTARCEAGDGTILGWVLQTSDVNHAEPTTSADPSLFKIALREAESNADLAASCLDPSKPDEAAYIEDMEGKLLVRDARDERKYFCISESAHAELKRATTELHALFMAATEHVLRNDALFEKFNIPRAIWPKIRESWGNRRNESITGRFDFSLSERGLKVYEYNCDSASCHMETGKIQGLWGQHYAGVVGYDAGRALRERLLHAWKGAHVDQVIHIMHDRDLEETYHALYMKEIIESAGIATRVLRGTRGLKWGPGGEVLDPEGTPIKWVWKTWSWETALDQIREECEDEEKTDIAKLTDAKRDRPPRLVDLLLRKGVMVYEPLWTLIPSNKAILPVLWRICPNHPYLLKSAFELRDELVASGYVVKPIVGRGGANISIVDRKSNVIAETGGKFEDQDQIYQEIWRLPKLDDLYVQICTFSAAGAYAGAGVRADRSVVISMESGCMPLRVTPDRQLGLDL